MPITNITLFGPAHSGKSTLAGYFQYIIDPKAAEHEIQKAQRELGPHHYDATHDLAYLVDRSKVERIRDPDKANESTSKQLHFTQTVIEESNENVALELMIIDTPGGWNWTRRTRVRGLFYAELAVFVIDVQRAKEFMPHQLAAHPNLTTETFGALFSWLAIKPDAPLIVAISQMDLAADAEADFEAARASIRAILDGVCDPVILPTSINVSDRTSENVIGSNRLSGQAGIPTLRDAIVDAAKTIPPREAVDQNVMIVSRELPKPGFGTGYFGKVLSGSFSVGDAIQMAPITHSNGMPFRYSGKIRKIMRTPDDALVETMSDSELGGFFFRANRARLGEIADGTIIVDDRTQLAMGRFVRVVIEEGEEQPDWLRFGVEVELLWFGRYSTMKVCEIRPAKSGGIKVSLLMKSLKQIAMPLSNHDDRPLFPEANLSKMKDAQSYAPCKIKFVGAVRGIRIQSSVYGLTTPNPTEGSHNEHCGMRALPLDTSDVEALLKRLVPNLSQNDENTLLTSSFELIDSGEEVEDE